MTGYRSEANSFPNKPNYKDLNMTLYPNQLDDRDMNLNMKGHVNVGEGKRADFVMAEYSNTTYDAIMAIQRALGPVPMVYKDAENVDELIETFTVANRITRIEAGLFDERYGGTGWQYVPGRPTLNNHSHTGKDGQPPQINLTKEVTGLLPKKNINLTQTDAGLTSSDIKVSKTDATTVAKALGDKLSKSKGGKVAGPTEFSGSLQSRFFKELSSENLTVATNCKLIADTTLTGQALASHATTKCTLVNQSLSSMHFGKYVAAVRLKVQKGTDLPAKTAIARFRIGSGQTQNLTAEEMGNNTYRMFYFVFDKTAKADALIVEKLATTQNATITIDNILIQPMHPSVLDR